HRVYRFVTHGERLASLVPSHQIGIYPFHLLSHKAKLCDALWVQLMLVAEGNRFERKDRFARFVHRFDLLLEPLGGRGRAKASVRVSEHAEPPRHRYSSDPGNIGRALISLHADPDRVGLSRYSGVANRDVITARGETRAGGISEGDIVAAGGVAHKRSCAYG